MNITVQNISWSSVILSILVLVLFIFITIRLNLENKNTKTVNINNKYSNKYPWYYRQQANPLIKRDLGKNPKLIKNDTKDLGQMPFNENETIYQPVNQDQIFYSPFIGICKKT